MAGPAPTDEHLAAAPKHTLEASGRGNLGHLVGGALGDVAGRGLL